MKPLIMETLLEKRFHKESLVSSTDHQLVSTCPKRERNKKLKIMAEVAVNLVVDHLIPFLIEEAKLLKGVQGEMEFIKDEMDSIRVVLKDADARAEIEEDVKVWVKQLRQVAFRMEDVLDEFRLRVSQQEPPRSGALSWVRQTFGYVKRLKPRHVVATEVKAVKRKLIQISERKERYHFKRLATESEKVGSCSSNNNDHWKYRRDDALYVEESELVGIKERKDQLISWLIEGGERRSVFVVVGTGGVGKTTLVRKAYESDLVRNQFYCHAWITISQSFKIEELLQKLIKQFQDSMKDSISPPLDEKLERTQLIDKLRSYLQGKRYVVVVDDVWSVELWISLKNALLDNHCGSRIMVTTRKNDVASSFVEFHFDRISGLSPLSLEDGLTLFHKKTFGSDFNGQCPPDLKELSEKLVMKSGGLPLAIVAMGGVLFTKEKTIWKWKKFHDNLSSNLGEDPNLRSVMKIISLSYQDLPYYLKSCFLYFGLFPEDYEVWSENLTNLWIAEGFVKDKMGKTLEEDAEDYLDQLVKRNLVQACPSSIYVNRIGYKVHDLMHQYILSRSLEEDFCEVLDGKATATSIVNSRRLSIQSTPNRDDALNNIGTPFATRSLLVFKLDKLPNSMMHTFLSKLVLLKVLSLKDAPLEDFPEEITNLLQLRYLDLNGTLIKGLPDTIAKLQDLETLYLQNTSVIQLPVGILKLRKLRHLEAYHLDDAPIVIPERIGLLTNLQSLSTVDVSQGTNLISELENLTQMRKLSIGNLRRENGMNLCAPIEKMHHLRILRVGSSEQDKFLELQFVSSPPSLLQKLHLVGRLEKLPDWVLSLKNLNDIVLAYSRVTEDLSKALQSLPNLEQILLGHNAYVGEELHFQAGNFQKLKTLTLYGLETLQSMVIQKGALTNLQEMTIGKCQQLKEMPTGIVYLKKLKTLSLKNMPTDFTSKLAQDGGEDYWKVRHVPRVINSLVGRLKKVEFA